MLNGPNGNTYWNLMASPASTVDVNQFPVQFNSEANRQTILETRWECECTKVWKNRKMHMVAYGGEEERSEGTM